MARKLIGTAITNENGEATITYTGTGAGKLNIVAESGTFQSRAHEVTDGMFYWDKTKNISNNWEFTNSLTGALNDDFLSIENTNTSTTKYAIPKISGSRISINKTDTLCIEFDIKSNKNWFRCGLLGANYITSSDVIANTLYHMKVTLNNEQIKWYVNDTLKDTQNPVNNTGDFSLGLLNVKYQLKNLIIYPI